MVNVGIAFPEGVGFNVIVVDNGSTDGSCGAIERMYPRVHLVRNQTNLGAAGGRNCGIAYAKKEFDHQYILFLDNDTIVDEKCLLELAAALDSDKATGIACPKAYQTYPSERIFSAGIHVNLYTASIYDIGGGELDRGQHNRPGTVRACGAFGFLIRSELANAIGGFDEAFNPYGWEDVDLCLRAARQGYKTSYVPGAVLFHSGGKAGRGTVPAYEKNKVRNFFLLMKGHAGVGEWLGCLVFAPIKALRLIVRGMAHGNITIVIAMLKGLLEALSSGRSVAITKNLKKDVTKEDIGRST